MSFTHHNHYVPVWYQKRFLPAGAGKYFFLKLRPNVVKRPDGGRHTEKALQRWGPVSCFAQDDLYTTRVGTVENDDIEKHLFGRIDEDGKTAIDHFFDYEVNDEAEQALHRLTTYMDAQVLRTPRGLERVRRLARAPGQNMTLLVMQQLRRMHQTMWLECQWEVIDCSGAGVDLLVSDNPVTFYNRAMFPYAPECSFPMEPELALLGTQTLFPLRKDKLLVLTHVQFARDPSYNPNKARINARYFGETVFDLRQIITHSRKLDAEGVLKVNYIIKQRAHEFIAASTEEGLYPERHLQRTHWPKLGEGEFLLPDPREIGFTTAILFGYDDGRPAWGQDEFGRPPAGDEMKDPDRAREWTALHRRQQEWDKRHGPLDHTPTHLAGMGPAKRRRSQPAAMPAAPSPASSENRPAKIGSDSASVFNRSAGGSDAHEPEGRNDRGGNSRSLDQPGVSEPQDLVGKAAGGG